MKKSQIHYRQKISIQTVSFTYEKQHFNVKHLLTGNHMEIKLRIQIPIELTKLVKVC